MSKAVEGVTEKIEECAEKNLRAKAMLRLR